MSLNDPASLTDSSRPLVPRGVWVVLFVIAYSGWIAFVIVGDADRSWRAFLINFLFFTPLAAGLTIWPAIVHLAHGKWSAGLLERPALAASGFAPVSLAAFIILAYGRIHWAGWLHYQKLPQGVWLNPIFVLIRDFLSLVLFWVLARRFARRRAAGLPTPNAGWLVFVYCVVFSLLGFDLVMALDPHWYSALFGGYFFISGVYLGVAGWILLSLRLDVSPERRTDLAKLLVAFSLLTTYMMYSQLLPIWYENLPQETRFVAPRMNIPQWRTISLILLAVIYLGPLVVLLTRWSKQTPAFLGFVALAVLVGMWIERWWLITPTLGGPLVIGLPELTCTLAFLSLFALSVGGRRKMEPAA